MLLGYSDHTQSNLASPLALVFGAKIFEKHFTLDNTLPGPDHWFSEDPNGLKNWIESIRTSKIMLGTKKLEPTKKEEEMKKIARRSIVALKDIDSNEILRDINIESRLVVLQFISPLLTMILNVLVLFLILSLLFLYNFKITLIILIFCC